MWNKFDSLNSVTWPKPDEQVLWRITINNLSHEPYHVLGRINITEGRPSVWDYAWDSRDDRFLDKNTETVYWMSIPPVENDLKIQYQKDYDSSFTW